MKRSQIVTEARRYKDVPFVHQGRSMRGVDCAGLIINVGKAVGAVSPETDVTPYPSQPDSKWMRDLLRKHLTLCGLEPKPGRIAFMSFPGDPTHLGIISEYKGIPYLIHASGKEKRVIEHRLDSVWKRSIRTMFEFPGVED